MEAGKDSNGAVKAAAEEGPEGSKKTRRTRWGEMTSQQPVSAAPAAAPVPPSPVSSLPSLSASLQAAASAARQALEKAKRAALIQKQIQEQLKGTTLAPSSRPQGPAATAVELTGEKKGPGAGGVSAMSAIAVAQATALAAAAKAKRDQLLEGDKNAAAQPLTLRAILGAAESEKAPSAAAGAALAVDRPEGGLGGGEMLAGVDASERQRQLFLMLHDQEMKKKQEAEEAERLKQEKLAAVLKARPRPLRIDQFGREVDEEGKVIPIQKRIIHSDLKINRRAQTEAKNEELAKAAGAPGAQHAAVVDLQDQPWFDPSIPVKTARTKRKRKAFEFVEQGRYVQQEQQMLQHQQFLEKKAQHRSRERGQGADSQPPEEGASRGSADSPAEQVIKEEIDAKEDEEPHAPDFLAKAWTSQVPSVEPWDAAILKVDPSQPEAIIPQDDALNVLVEHPVPVKPAIDTATNVIINMYLTKQEWKKLRRRKRQEKEREKQDKIRMGLLPPPPPKVKLTNLMRVLGDQAVADPSKVEKEVRQQMEKRLKDHEARNQARKLAPEARSKKHAAKWQKKPNSGEFQVLLFCLKDLTNKRHLYKVDVNAQQLHLAGVAVICPSSLRTIVLVEGSLRSIKRFRALMMRRIKWRELEGSSAVNDDDDDDDEDKPEVNDDSCCLVWQGAVRTNSFSGWKVHRVAGEADGRKIFKSAHVEHYWDMAQKFRRVNEDM